jgi:type II secretory pathway predicted ATPase ExeA
MSTTHTPRWLAHFHLTEPPFDKAIEDDALWMPSSRQSVVDELVEAVQERQHVLLTGEPGIGKTCVLRAVRHRLQSGFRLTYCHNATLGRRDFYRQLCLAIGLSPKATAAAVFYAVSTHVQELAREHVRPVFLLDEAHLLHQDVLDHLHIISNYEWDSAPLLSLVLVGLPDLRDRMQLRRNRSLWSRVHARLALDNPHPEDSVEYVQYRLKRAGGDEGLFSSDALAFLHEASEGHLRNIDRLATAALKTAARRKLKRVDRELVQHVAAEEGR